MRTRARAAITAGALVFVPSSCAEVSFGEPGLDAGSGAAGSASSAGAGGSDGAGLSGRGRGGGSGNGSNDGGGEEADEDGGREACPAPPPPGGAKPCNVCQDEDHVGCACAAELAACFDDPECLAIRACVIVGETGAGVKACPIVFSAAAASCVRSCMDLHPSAAARFLALESCMYCDYCAKSCDTGLYCGELLGTDGGAGALVDASASGL